MSEPTIRRELRHLRTAHHHLTLARDVGGVLGAEITTEADHVDRLVQRLQDELERSRRFGGHQT